MVEVEFLLVCDYAADNNGKLTVVGVFDNVNAVTLPTLFNFYIASKFYLSKQDLKDFEVKLVFLDKNKKKFRDDFTIKPENSLKEITKVDKLPMNLALNVLGVNLNKTGIYSINLYVNGTKKKSTKFEVKLIK